MTKVLIVLGAFIALLVVVLPLGALLIVLVLMALGLLMAIAN